jgi:hypothetical protein
MTRQQPEPAEGFEPVPFAPTETRVMWTLALWQGKPVVQITMSTPAGIAAYYFPPDAADALAAGIAGAAATARAQTNGSAAGIIVPDVDVQAVLRSIKDEQRKGGER